MRDFSIQNHGSICLLTPNTPRAQEWLDEHIDPDAMKWGGGVVIEPRFFNDVLNGIDAEGMTF